jgi:hypothetical protein
MIRYLLLAISIFFAMALPFINFINAELRYALSFYFAGQFIALLCILWPQFTSERIKEGTWGMLSPNASLTKSIGFTILALMLLILANFAFHHL